MWNLNFFPSSQSFFFFSIFVEWYQTTRALFKAIFHLPLPPPPHFLSLFPSPLELFEITEFLCSANCSVLWTWICLWYVYACTAILAEHMSMHTNMICIMSTRQVWIWICTRGVREPLSMYIVHTELLLYVDTVHWTFIIHTWILSMEHILGVMNMCVVQYCTLYD